MIGNSEMGKNGFEDLINQVEKGVVVENFVQQNCQLEFFNYDLFKFVKEKQKEIQVWVLLYYYDKVLNEVCFELFLLIGFGNKKIIDWGVCLILGSIFNNLVDFMICKDVFNEFVMVEVEFKIGMF